MFKQLLVITGPTAAGKTGLGIALAKRFGGEIVSADSMQVYRELSIGTAKPSPAERAAVPHHMLDVAGPAESYSVARYTQEAAACIDSIFSRGRLPILVGGTGLYIDSLLSGRYFAQPSEDSGLREELNTRYAQEGGDALRRELAAVDPEAAARLHPNDKKRIVRALEVYRVTGKSISAHNRETKALPPRYAALKIALCARNRADLYRRIDCRVDEMAARGLQGEVENLLKGGLPRNSGAMQAIGYKEMARAVFGEISPEAAIEEIKRESRRYAKRQLSWLRRDEAVKWIYWDEDPEEEILLQISTEFCFAAGIMIPEDKSGKLC